MKLSYIIEEMRNHFISKEVFDLKLKAIEDEITPLQRIVYGFIVLILTAVGSYFVNLAIKKP